MAGAGYGIHQYLAAIHGEQVRSARLSEGRGEVWYNRRTFLRHHFGYFQAFAKTGSHAGAWKSAEEICQTILEEDASVDMLKILLPETFRGEYDKLNITRSARINGYHVSAEVHSYNETITLPGSFSDFLETLGSHTRRDIRRFRRKAAAAGLYHEMQWNPPVSNSGWDALCRKIHRKADSYVRMNRLQHFLNKEEADFHSLIYDASGVMVACCAGFICGDGAIIFYQLNDPDHRRACLSLINNSFLIEALMERGIKEFILPLRGAGLLSNVCKTNRYAEMMLIRDTPVTVLKALGISWLSRESPIGIGARKIFRQSTAKDVVLAPEHLR